MEHDFFDDIYNVYNKRIRYETYREFMELDKA
jgi:hypothetical protein